MIVDKAKEIWNFFRTAGVLQAVVDGNALRFLKNLPNENWAVLSCPTKGLDFDARTLQFLDGNGDGHIRIEEVLNALSWLEVRIADLSDLLAGKDEMPLSSFADTEDGKALAEAAKSILEHIGKEGADRVSLADILERQASFKAADFNGDGVLVPSAAAEAGLETLVGEIVSATGGVDDRSGAKGVDKATLDSFFADCSSWLAWLDGGKARAAEVLPLGDGTADAVAAMEAVRAKIDDWFDRCSLIAFDEAAAAPLNVAEGDYAEIGRGTVAANAAALEALPLAKATASGTLPLGSGINPQWSARLADFAAKAVEPLVGKRDALSSEDWRLVKEKLAPYIAWKASEEGARVATLGEARVREIAADAKAKATIEALIEKDVALSGEIDQLDDLEKLLRYRANLVHFLNNYVNFSDYYDPEKSEIYRAGRLYIDGRVCRECVYVTDAGSHSTLAASSKMFLAYCNISRPQTGETRTICAAVTAGFSATLWVGRNGIFYDAEGRDWNAVITKIVECQISLKEAFWAPWIKISDLISDQIKKLLSSKESAMMTAASTEVGTIGAAPAPAPEQKRDGAAMASSVAAIGIALGIMGSAIGGLISALKGISFWYGILGVLAIILVVSGPSVILAWFKLRSRDFAPVLNACGWAINKKMLMPMRLSRIFTHEAVVPADSNIDMRDPYVEKHFWRNFAITVVIIVAAILAIWKWRYGWIPENYWPKFMQKPAPAEVVSAEEAPEAEATTAESLTDAAPDATAADSTEAPDGGQ